MCVKRRLVWGGGTIIAAGLLAGVLLAQEAGPATTRPAALTGRIEVESHDEYFTVRFYLRNEGAATQRIEFGRGSAGLENVPAFKVGYVSVTPPIYRLPPRRSMRPVVLEIPPGEEMLYGVFTMGWPATVGGRLFEISRHGKAEMHATFQYERRRAPLRTPAVSLEIPDKVRAAWQRQP
jgi:hypothetical protein